MYLSKFQNQDKNMKETRQHQFFFLPNFTVFYKLKKKKIRINFIYKKFINQKKKVKNGKKSIKFQKNWPFRLLRKFT